MPGTSKSFNLLGREFYRTPTGDILNMGKKSKPTVSDSVSLDSNNPVESLIPSGGNPYQMDNPLVSDAKTRKITGGSRADRREAKGLASGVSVQGGIGLASGILNEFNQDDKYDNKDVALNTLDYASKGLQYGGVWGAAAGGVYGLFKGLKEKKEFNAEQKRIQIKEGNDAVVSQGADFKSQGDQRQNLDAYYGANKSGNLYGAQDIDNFITQNRV